MTLYLEDLLNKAKLEASPDCSGYAVEQSGTAFERKAGSAFLDCFIVSLQKNLFV